MADSRTQSKEKYVSDSDNFLLKYSDYLHGYRVIRRYSDLKPFYIEMVDENGKAVDLPYPSQENSRSNERILGLKLMINPSSLSLNAAKIINRNQTMTSWVEDHWGEEIDTITLNGSSASFVVGGTSLRSISNPMVSTASDKITARADFYGYLGLTDYNVQSPAEQRLMAYDGLTVRNRKDTASYQEMKQLIKIFSANGCIYDDSGFVQQRRFIRVTFDYSSYVGYFESFDLTEEAYKPFTFTYTITYKAEKTIFRFKTVN